MPPDGGSAFPRSDSPSDALDLGKQRGMSMRDWFAGQALSAVVAQYHSTYDPDGLATFAYAIADAVVKKMQEC